MSHDNILQEAARHRQFQELFCAELGLPAPKPWTEDDEGRYRAWIENSNRRLTEWAARRKAIAG
ncbi:hypothetical protein [Actinoplanes siamensis]|nr:hypothetical protein [Actinoplanes siamensis]